MDRKVNILDKIGALIPGYSGYAERDGRRNCDKILRESIANQLISSIDLTNKFNLYSHENSSFYWETSHKIVHSNPAELTHAVDVMRAESMKALSHLNTLFLTLGTSWVYELADSGLLVANCHKLPASNFTKRLLSIKVV